MKEKPIRMVLEGGGWGIGGLGCLVAVALAVIGVFVRLPNIVPGPAFLDAVVWVIAVLLLAVVLEQASGLFSPDKVLELDGDLLRVRCGKRVDWERRLPGPSGFKIWHLVTPREDDDRDDDIVTLLIEVQSGLGDALVLCRDVDSRREEAVRRDYPRWQRAVPSDAGANEEGVQWIQIDHTFEGDRVLKALLERAGGTG